MDQDLFTYFQSTLSCTICLDVFSNPYTVKCGHTFCGSCLHEWIKKVCECPICRTKITIEPIFNLILKDQSEKLISFMPNKTIPQKIDFNWKPFIKSLILDISDRVERCMNCHWEIFDGECACTRNSINHSVVELISSDSSQDDCDCPDCGEYNHHNHQSIFDISDTVWEDEECLQDEEWMYDDYRYNSEYDDPDPY